MMLKPESRELLNRDPKLRQSRNLFPKVWFNRLGPVPTKRFRKMAHKEVKVGERFEEGKVYGNGYWLYDGWRDGSK